MNNIKFECSGCGLCCKKISVAVENTKHIAELHFPYTWDENGVCENLDSDNKCKVYEDRPLLCNVERFAEVYELDRKQFFEDNYQSCNILKQQDNNPI